MPASSTTMSACSSANHFRAMAAISSNSVGGSAIASACGRTDSVSAARASGEIISPFSCIRSRKSTTQGEMNRPVRYPASVSTEESMAAVLPLPLVPTM